MSSQNLKNKSIDELREMKAKGEAELNGAMLEKFLGCPNELTDEQVEEILKIAFQSEAVGRAIEQFRDSNENTTL